MLIRVFKIPPADGRFCFGGGKPMPFTEVDWFRDDDGRTDGEAGREMLICFIKQKNYYSDETPLLVLTERGTFTLNYSAP